MLQQAHAIATAQQEMARLAAADHRQAIAQHEHRLQQMHDAQASTHTKQQHSLLIMGFDTCIGSFMHEPTSPAQSLAGSTCLLCYLLPAMTSADIACLY